MLRIFTSLVIIAVICVFSSEATAAQSDHEAELIKYLKQNITDFSPLLRPTKAPNKLLKISVGGMVCGLVSVDSARQSVKLAVFLMATWPEERLVWDPAKFGNLTVINWDFSQTWFPVIILYNGIGDSQVLTPQIPVFLKSVSPNLTRSTASWRREIEFTCQLNMQNFPLDRHVCDVELFFSDQGNNNRLIQLVDDVPSLNTLGIYKENGEWQMINATSLVEYRRYQVFQSMPPVQLPTYILRIEVQRVSVYYFMNIITPLMLLTLLQVLVYFVPLESGEKLGFGVTIMLSYTMFLLLLDNILPKSRAIPAIATFITAAMIISTVSLLLMSVIMRFHFASNEPTPMPHCLRVVFVRFLGRLFCVTAGSCGRPTKQQVGHAPVTDRTVSDVSIRKLDGEVNSSPSESDWILAARAVERLMVALGLGATVAIIVVFVVQPYI